jgi:hypothetical protein
MKRRTSWFSGVAAGALALSALAVSTGAAPASAATLPTHLCVTYPAGNVECVYAPTTVGDNAEMGATSSSTTNWYYQQTSGDQGEIMQAGGKTCLQVNASAGGVVRGAKCVGDSAEEWINFYNSYTHHTMFISLWYVEDSASSDRCLSASTSPLVVVDDCSGDNVNDWYLQWHT